MEAPEVQNSPRVTEYKRFTHSRLWRLASASNPIATDIVLSERAIQPAKSTTPHALMPFIRDPRRFA